VNVGDHLPMASSQSESRAVALQLRFQARLERLVNPGKASAVGKVSDLFAVQ
jgi:hypothetical protein